VAAFDVDRIAGMLKLNGPGRRVDSGACLELAQAI
jgi:hypothetical protein